MSNRASKQPKPKKSQRLEKKTKIQISPLGLILGAATLIGGLVALLTLLPRLTVTMSDPPNPDDPFSASATVTNTGFIPLREVTPFISVKSVKNTGGFTFTDKSDPPYGMKIRRDSWQPQDLSLDDKFTVALNDTWNSPDLQSADLAIVVQYELPIIPWHRTKVFPWVAHRQTNGKFYWYAKAAD